MLHLMSLICLTLGLHAAASMPLFLCDTERNKRSPQWVILIVRDGSTEAKEVPDPDLQTF